MLRECVELLQNEISALHRNRARAEAKPGVQQEELQNIGNKIRLKTELLGLLERKLHSAIYAVFWKHHASEYEPDPEWTQFGAWYPSLEDTTAELERVLQNPRCAAAKVVMRMEIYEDCGVIHNA